MSDSDVREPTLGTEIVLGIVADLPTQFGLNEVYKHAHRYSAVFPDNHHVKAKLRQQLQVLESIGIIDFLDGPSGQKVPRAEGTGNYRHVGVVVPTQESHSPEEDKIVALGRAMAATLSVRERSLFMQGFVLKQGSDVDVQ